MNEQVIEKDDVQMHDVCVFNFFCLKKITFKALTGVRVTPAVQRTEIWHIKPARIHSTVFKTRPQTCRSMLK